jgi:transcriptional regulator PpsR
VNISQSFDRPIAFNDADAIFDGFAKSDIIALAYCAGDFLLAINEQQTIIDVAMISGDHHFIFQWVGRKWTDLVTIESAPKITEMLSTAKGKASLDNPWRQVNHRHVDGDIPVNFKVIAPTDGGIYLAVGRDLRALAALQQRLLKTQQSMERDYLSLRQAETRYRLLFDNLAHPVLIADFDSRTVQQANRACHALLGLTPGALVEADLLTLFDSSVRDRLIGYLGAAVVNHAVGPLELALAGTNAAVRLTAAAFRQSGRQLLLVHIDDGTHTVPDKRSDRYILDVVEQMPDAFVLTNDRHAIIAANRAFADMVQAGSAEALIGRALGDFVGRPDVDLTLLRKQLLDHHSVRNFGSLVVDETGGREPVEISAIMLEREAPVFGYSVRAVGRRERDLPPAGGDVPRSVEQLTELVGRKPLKEIVRESTDLIERMCIEAALIHTSDNRASAAEILGLSRQSLYSKLHRHGLGNLSDRD